MKIRPFLRHLAQCNRHDPVAFRPFHLAGHPIGKMRPETAQTLTSSVTKTENGFALKNEGTTPEERSASLAAAAAHLAERGQILPLLNEAYSVFAGWGAPILATLDRSAMAAFGFPAFGLHVNGIVERSGIPHLWIAERAQDRRVAPGKLDSLIGGGMPHGLTMAENLAKEAKEEAGLPASLLTKARGVSLLSYRLDVPVGVKNEFMVIYDLTLPEDCIPKNQDGEVAAFHCWPIETVAHRVAETDDFKFNVNLVMMDYLLRYGFFSPDDEDYVTLTQGLRGQSV